jgi:SSS family solute:Na+ symporter
MNTLQFVDYLAMLAYFLILIWIGISVVRSRKDENKYDSFLAADRNMNLLQTTSSAAATDIGGAFSIAMGGLGFTLGVSGSWMIAVSGLSIVMVSFLMVPKVKRWSDKAKGLTTGDLFAARFDRRTGTLAAVVIGISWFTFVGGQIIAGGKLLQVTLNMDLTLAVLVSGAVILAYTTMGGLKAVIYTDVFQMLVLMIGIVFIAVPIGLIEVGGWSAMAQQFNSSESTKHLLDWSAVGWSQLLDWFFAIFPVWFISIAAMQRIVAAKDVKTAQRGFFLTGIPIEWPLFAIGSTMIGLFARYLIPDLTDPELATPMIIMQLLPAGVAGLVIAAYIAAVMSSADSCLMGPVAIFTNDIYKRYINPESSEQHLVRIARYTTVILGVLAILIAYLIPNILELILYAYTFGSAGIFFPMLGLLFWPKTTAKGAFWSMLLGGSSAVIYSVIGEPFGIAACYLEWITPIRIGWIIGLPTLIIVSLFSKHSPEEDPDLFV